MRTNRIPHLDAGNSTQAIHRALQNGRHGSKSASHRVERRKLREYLRHPDTLDSHGLDLLR